jgi:hypothetical protein
LENRDLELEIENWKRENRSSFVAQRYQRMPIGETEAAFVSGFFNFFWAAPS